MSTSSDDPSTPPADTSIGSRDSDARASGEDPANANGQGVDELSNDQKDALRTKHYNATIIDRRDIHESLGVFRIRPDEGFEPFEAGQYVALGLGNWEPRIPDSQDEPLPPTKRQKLARRAYSISCPMVDLSKADAPTPPLLSVNDVDYLEFYVALVRYASDPDQKPPSLTPRLFGMQAGDRIEVAKKIVGHYVATGISPDETVLMIGTGTGEAPHNAMAASLLSQGHRGRIIHVTTVRKKQDLAYAKEHATLSHRFPNYLYVPLTTREPENTDSSHPDYVGKQYVQRWFQSGQLADHVGDPLSPDKTHVFLCGNPAMIGYTPPGSPPLQEPGMIQLLTEAGFTDDHDRSGPGVIRFEKYW